ncbi:hypothetical protein [Nonomuraea wenchangensis]|uniref:Uncharacterized protein n=1 Tax=Nonomuraea wenchangensis TaxID=568860 RepID=A0A1I0LS53_9ACTN|nr:hypothetical protein [Nonomuraea wenchangensis]SEU44180.1 hypothetical protein SAMN05421811_122178 [Nonomuraea wenchangensis]
MSWFQMSQAQAVILAATVGATGAIIGGAIASLLTQLLSGRAQRRRQWDEIRHTAYARVTETFHTALGLYDVTGRLRADRMTERRAADDLLAAYSRAALLSRTDSTMAALEHLHDVAQDLWDRPSRPWPEIDGQCRHAERAFRRAARAELGLPTRRGLPEPALLPTAQAPHPAELGRVSAAPLSGAGADDADPGSEKAKDSFTENVPSAGDEHK